MRDEVGVISREFNYGVFCMFLFKGFIYRCVECLCYKRLVFNRWEICCLVRLSDAID